MGFFTGALATVMAAPRFALALFAPQAVLATEASSTADLTTFFGFATSALTWLITTFGTILNFMLANPICFVGLIFSLIGLAFVYLRSTIGG